MSLGIDAKARVDVDYSITLTLTVNEAKALEAIAGYGTQAFLEVFYAKLGRYYLQPTEKDVILFLEKCSHCLPQEIRKIEEAQKAIAEATKQLRE